MTCLLRPELERREVLFWVARCEHTTAVSGSWGPRNVTELRALEELAELRLEQLPGWHERAGELPLCGPWVDPFNELQGAYHLEQLRRVWCVLHGAEP